jgi:hypothetical protein
MQNTKLREVDWEAMKIETRCIEGQLGEWFVNGEVEYLRNWSYCFAERKAEHFGIPFNHERYIKLQIATRNQVMRSAYGPLKDLLKKSPRDYMRLQCKLVAYEDIERLIKESEVAVRKISNRK